jgi:Asp/Glu/hydantoin racemase
MTTKLVRKSTRILVVNPNSSESMTHGIEKAIKGMHLPEVSDPSQHRIGTMPIEYG